MTVGVIKKLAHNCNPTQKSQIEDYEFRRLTLGARVTKVIDNNNIDIDKSGHFYFGDLSSLRLCTVMSASGKLDLKMKCLNKGMI